MTPNRLAFCLSLALSAASVHSQAPTAAPPGPILAAPPAAPDSAARYVFYLHGAIVEQQGEDARHPHFGRYEYRAILAALAAPGHTVISERRPAGTAVGGYARKLVGQLRALLVAGVPAQRISVIGASKGGAIALAAARALGEPGIGWIVLGACSARERRGGLHGDLLSIHEQSDAIGRSCSAAIANSPQLGARRELLLHTGQQHGFLYRPLPDWVQPALAWISRRGAA